MWGASLTLGWSVRMVRDAGPDAARPHFSLAFAASALPRLAWTGSAGGRGGRVRGWAADPCQQPSRAAAWNRVRSPYGACYGSRRCRRRPSSWTNRLRSVASRSSNPETPSSSTRPLANDLGQGPNSARPGRRAEPRRRLHRREHRRRLPQPGGHLSAPVCKFVRGGLCGLRERLLFVQPAQQLVEVGMGEAPVERDRGLLVAALEGEQPPFDLDQAGGVVGGEDFALDHREDDLDLVQPGGVDGQV